MSSKTRSSLPTTCSKTLAVMEMPPGSASPSRRAAMFTPSPRMSSPSITISPRLMPARYWMRRSLGAPASVSAIARWIRTALSSASTTLPNSTSRPSPVVLTMRPPCSCRTGSISSWRWDLWRAMVPASSASMCREKPTISIARMAASLRTTRSVAKTVLRLRRARENLRSLPGQVHAKGPARRHRQALGHKGQVRPLELPPRSPRVRGGSERPMLPECVPGVGCRASPRAHPSPGVTHLRFRVAKGNNESLRISCILFHEDILRTMVADSSQVSSAARTIRCQGNWIAFGAGYNDWRH